VEASYRRLFHQLLPELVASEDPGRFYTRSSPSANDDTIAANQPGSGDMHYWGVWHVAEPYERYADNVSRFMSEYGFQSFPELATIASFAPATERRLDSEVMRAHQRHPRGNELIQEYLQRDFRPPRDFECFSYVSQVLQATVIQFAAEAHRRKMPYNWGSLYWQLNDCWPVASWSSIDYFGRWKALHHHARRFFAPILASVCMEGELLRVYGVSDRRTPTPARLELRLLDFNGEVAYRQQHEVSLAANASQVYFEAPRAQLLGGRDARTLVFVADLYESGTQLVSRGLHYFVKSKELELPDPELQLEQQEQPRAGHTIIRLRARRLARAVWLSAEPVAPAVAPFTAPSFSENYFDLLPGEAHELVYGGPAPQRIALRSLRDSY
jgi:beta-mannosidase